MSSDVIVHQPRAVVAERLNAAAALPHGALPAGLPMLGIAVRKERSGGDVYEWRFQALGHDYARYAVTLIEEDRQTTRATFDFQRIRPAAPLDRKSAVRNYRYLQDIAELIAAAHVRATMNNELIDIPRLNADIEALPSWRTRRAQDFDPVARPTT